MAESAPRIVYRLRAIRRMIERGITLAEVEAALATGEVIAAYPDDQPYPSRLVLGWAGRRPFHVVVADDRDGERLIVVTVYEPDDLTWMDFRRRKKP